jgi:excisionase family DNA binding protein
VKQKGHPVSATETLPKLLSVDELARHLGTSSGHLRRLVAARRVPYLKVGGYVRFDPVEIAAWLDRSRVTTPPRLPSILRPTIRKEPAGQAGKRVDRQRGTVTEQRRYADHRPYPDPPARLADLTGPTSGVVELPITIDWGPRRRYDLGTDADRRIVYERVLREAGDAEEVGRYVNGAILVDVWSRLWLPQRVRRTWEQRFPELTHAA